MIDVQQSLAVYDRGNVVSDHSGWVDFIAYDEQRRELFLRLQKNPTTVYVYHNVPPSVFHEMNNNQSVGGYYSTWIKGNYSGERLNDYDLVWRPSYEQPDEPAKVGDEAVSLETDDFGKNPQSLTASDVPQRTLIDGLVIFGKGWGDVDSIKVQNSFTNTSAADAREMMNNAASVLGLGFRITKVTEEFD